MRLVTDGEFYAIEQGWPFKKYCSLLSPGIWWNLEDSHQTCWGSKEKAEAILRLLQRKQRIRIVE